MRLILLGPPGSGKGVQGELMQKRLGVPRISTGDMFREAIQKKSEESADLRAYLEAGKLVPDAVVLRTVEKRLSHADCANGFILDGFPRTVFQGESLEQMLQKRQLQLDCVLSLEVPTTVIIDRITSRRVCSKCAAVFNVKTSPPPADGVCLKCGGSIIQRSDDCEETVLNRLMVYDEQTKPLKDFYRQRKVLTEITGQGTVEEIHGRILAALEQ